MVVAVILAAPRTLLLFSWGTDSNGGALRGASGTVLTYVMGWDWRRWRLGPVQQLLLRKTLHGAWGPWHPYGCGSNLHVGFAEFGWVMSRFGCAVVWFQIMGGVDGPRGGYLFNLSSRFLDRRPHSMPTGGLATSPSHCGKKPMGRRAGAAKAISCGKGGGSFGAWVFLALALSVKDFRNFAV